LEGGRGGIGHENESETWRWDWDYTCVGCGIAIDAVYVESTAETTVHFKVTT
jgi:hypothetical protein